LHVGKDLAGMTPVSQEPTAKDLEEAKRILHFPLWQFPFKTHSDYAHALTLEFLQFVRDMIDGPVPIYAVIAPTERTGKGKLIKTICAPGLGAIIGAMAELDSRTDETELRKRLTALVLQGDPVVWIDNIDKEVKGGALAALVTSEHWKDRILGKSAIADAPVRICLVLAGNGLTFSRELLKCGLLINLDARLEHPDQRTFDEPLEPEVYALAHRAELV
jgi:putative DNA primase/helicase